MKTAMFTSRSILMTALCVHTTIAQTTTQPPPASQNPSPMVEHTRKHERLEAKTPPGIERVFAGPLDKPVQVFIPTATTATNPIALVIHFLGAAFVAEQSVARLDANAAAANVSIGAGSGIFDRTFSDPLAFDTLLAKIKREVAAALNTDSIRIASISLTGFSAGHGAIRAILRDARHFALIDNVLLMDGLHTSYVPEGVVMEKGGTVDESKLVELAQFAQLAMQGRKRMLITHSEIFPGTFASTTETTDWLIGALGLSRTPVLKWGARGLQQLSEVRSGQFAIQGFAGNTAPDHIDQFHAMPELLEQLMALKH